MEVPTHNGSFRDEAQVEQTLFALIVCLSI